MYRSFVTCDDPKGVECSTVRKLKSGSQKREHKMQNLRKAKKKDTSTVGSFQKEQMVSKSSMEKSSDASAFQLMKVSQGAQQLNQMIDSWSKGLKYDGQSNDIANDLLKGALELQESLSMLHRMQEVNHSTAHMKKKQNEISEKGRTEETTMNRMCPKQAKDKRHPVEFEKPRHSIDGSSRNYVEDLKQVIKESLVKQNLLASTPGELDLASEIPSTSSGQSFLTQADLLTESSFSSASSRKKEKGSNLIAKLMGLEELPSKPFQVMLQKQLEGEKILNQSRTVTDIGTVNAKNRQSAIQKDNWSEDKTFKEILEAMHFKGLLKSHSARMHKPQVYNFNHSPSELRSLDDRPPIVLIKPFLTSNQEMEESNQLLQGKDNVLKKGLAFRNVNGKHVHHRLTKSEENTLNFNKTQKRRVVEDLSTKCHTQKEGPKDLNLVGIQYEKEGKPKEKAVKKAKLPYHLNGGVDKIQGVGRRNQANIISRKSKEKEFVKANIVCSPQNQQNAISTDVRRTRSELNIKKNRKQSKQNIASEIISSRTHKEINDKDQKKNQIRKARTLRKPKPEKEKNLGCDDMNKNCFTDESHPAEVRTTNHYEVRITEVDQPPLENEIDALILKIEEHTKNHEDSHTDIMMPIPENQENSHTDIVMPLPENHENSHTDALMPIPEHRVDVSRAERACDQLNCGNEDMKRIRSSTDVKHILLSCQSFVNHAEELFNLNLDCPIVPHHLENTCFPAKLYMDCANELLERKANHDLQIVHPLSLTFIGTSRFCISLDSLVEEISDGIQRLEFYSKTSGKNLSVDCVYVMMERDIRSKGLACGIWDSGWRHGFSGEGAEQVVNDIVKLVLSGLIDELIHSICTSL